MRHEAMLLRDAARELRQRSTDAERALWSALRGRGFLGLKFRRQHSIGRFVVDFYCEDLRLAIELDGAAHFEPGVAELDAGRTGWLQDQGVTVVRVENEELLLNGPVVFDRLRRMVDGLRVVARA